MILEQLIVGPIEENCYIFGDEETKEAVIVDPGDEALLILDRVKQLGMTVTRILNTHGHVDHIAALADLKEQLGVPNAIHEADAPLLARPNREALIWLGRTLPKMDADQLLHDGDTIPVGKLNLEVIHTPGHSPGGVCYHYDGILFSGDTLFAMGIGRFDTPGGDVNKLLASITTRLFALPDETVVYPGHGPSTTIGNERRYNPFVGQQRPQLWVP
ncbi:MAG: MBL fold metallo-hydrolase [Chloroflexi bacterium]|nr:MBL fold metallo-hydrolase [Chloroflexota bacterium]